MTVYDRSRWIALHRLAAAAALVAATAGLLARPASAQSAEVRYERARAREADARASRTTPVASLRSIATAYEIIVRRFPRSGYCDNALWQAAGLRLLAFERGADPDDRVRAQEYLTWLRREYPSSSLIRQIPARVGAMKKGTTGTTGTTGTAGTTGTTGTAGTTAVAAVPAPRPPEPRAFPAASGSEEAPAGAAPVETIATVRSIAYTRLPKGDRITLELSQEVAFTSAREANPDQLVLDFTGVAAAERVRDAARALRGTFVNGLRLDAGPGVTQLTLQLDGTPRYSTFPLYDPYRLVIDVEGTSPSVGPASPAAAPAVARGDAPERPDPPADAPPAEEMAKPEAPASTSRGDYSLARQLGLGVSRIVIDPGHGGHDPGAQANALSEAELVLDVSLRLAELLEGQPGFEVVLTRRTDTFVALEERTAIANREGADLFLSIHANSSPNRETRGIETYILNFAESASAEAVAARENASTAQAMHILPELVKTIATSNKVAESREFASMVQDSLMRRIGALSRTIKNLGVKQAPFVVLIGAQMPSVLAEISFLTNKTEAGLLKQAAHRQRIAQALCDAVLRYQASLKTNTVATRSSGP